MRPDAESTCAAWWPRDIIVPTTSGRCGLHLTDGMGAARTPAFRDVDGVASGRPGSLPVAQSVAPDWHLESVDWRTAAAFEEAAPNQYMGSTGQHHLGRSTGRHVRRGGTCQSQKWYRRRRMRPGGTGHQEEYQRWCWQ